MKKVQRLASLGVIACIALLAGCHPSTSSSSAKVSSGTSSTVTSSQTDSGFYVTYKGAEVKDGDAFDIYINDKVAILTALKDDNTAGTFTFASSDDAVLAVGATGLLTPAKAGSATITVTFADNGESVKLNFTVKATTVSSGAQSFTNVSYDEKSRILASLEKYAVDNYLTGLTMFSNGGYACYNARYVPTPKEYVVGYGWGTAREGVLTDTLPKAAGGHPTYYTIGTTQVAQQANAMNASGSDVSDLYGYISSSYFSNRLNETKDGYEWYPSLSVDNENRPVAIDDSGNPIENPTTNRRWRIHLKDNVYYATGSTKTKGTTDLSTYNHKKVELADYLTPLKFMLTAWNAQYRGAELTTGVSGFAGAADYYGATNAGTRTDVNALWDDAKWTKYMGDNIKTGTDSTGNYIEYNLIYPCTQFYAMYYLSSSLYSPLPESFIKLWGDGKGGKNKLGTNSSDGSYSPVDTMLSTGPYYLTYWEAYKQITLQKNPYYYTTQDTFSDGTTRKVYQLPGIDMVQLDSTALQNNFEIGTIDNYGPDKDTLKNTYNTSSGTSASGVKWNRYQTKGDANFKLNLNATSQEQWNKLFGTSGTVYAHSSTDLKNSYATRKEYLSDKNFLNFLSYSLDRETICKARGTTPTQEYFSDNYLIDPENGISYNSTPAHKAVLADRYNETYGYNEAAAKKALAKAMDDTIIPLAEAGKLKAGSGSGAGTSSNPWQVTIDMAWMNPNDTKDYSDVFDSIKKVFSEEIADDYGGAYTLVINQDSGSSDYNQVYKKMKQGEFDLGFGAISGNDLNPLNFFEVLKSDNSSGFTLNWGPDTDAVSSDIVYDGKTWSFDGLWKAADSGVVLASDGAIAKLQNTSSKLKTSDGKTFYESVSGTGKTDGTITYKISFQQLVEGGATNLKLSISNASYTSEAMTLETLGITADTSWAGLVTIDQNLNNYVTQDASGNDVDNDCTVATLTVTFDITINGTKTTTSSSIKLPTYMGK